MTAPDIAPELAEQIEAAAVALRDAARADGGVSFGPALARYAALITQVNREQAIQDTIEHLRWMTWDGHPSPWFHMVADKLRAELGLPAVQSCDCGEPQCQCGCQTGEAPKHWIHSRTCRTQQRTP